MNEVGDTARAGLIVLIVEDDAMLRALAVDMIEDAGFTAVTAENAAAAIAILERRTDIQLVFTDIDMPMGIDGLRLAAIVRDRWPPIHIIIVSGKGAPDAALMPERARFFPKPYDQREVVDAMRRMAT